MSSTTWSQFQGSFLSFHLRDPTLIIIVPLRVNRPRFGPRKELHGYKATILPLLILLFLSCLLHFLWHNLYTPCSRSPSYFPDAHRHIPHAFTFFRSIVLISLEHSISLIHNPCTLWQDAWDQPRTYIADSTVFLLNSFRHAPIHVSLLYH